MGKVAHHGQWFWERFDPAKDTGADLAVLRRGLGHPAGSVPDIWRFYRARIPEEQALRGNLSRELIAEHAALTLFGVHQQSQRLHMHIKDQPIGAALRMLRRREDISTDALDRRVNAAATSASLPALVGHLRGLLTQLRGKQIALDYNSLIEDLHDWMWPDSRARARRRWGVLYYRRLNTEAADGDTDEPDLGDASGPASPTTKETLP